MSSKPRLLLIFNPHATRASKTSRRVVVEGLCDAYDLEVAETRYRSHAEEIARAASGYDVVAAYGGDGTVNEVANGLVGQGDISLAVLPGGFNNVVCRSLGFTRDLDEVVRCLSARGTSTRRLELGKVELARMGPSAGDGVLWGEPRYFLFGSGVGFDAEALAMIERHSSLKRHGGLVAYAFAIAASYLSATRRSPMTISCDSEVLGGAQLVVQKMDPYTYANNLPFHVVSSVADGGLSVVVLPRAQLRVVLPVLKGILKEEHLGSLPAAWEALGVQECLVSSASPLGRPLMVHADGEILGAARRIRYTATSESVNAIAAPRGW